MARRTHDPRVVNSWPLAKLHYVLTRRTVKCLTKEKRDNPSRANILHCGNLVSSTKCMPSDYMSTYYMSTYGLLSALTVLLSAVPGYSETNWKAGVASIAITPREPIMMAGYAYRVTPSRGLLMDLKAKALALQDQTGATAVIVTMDLLVVHREVAQAVAQAVEAKYHVPRSRLMFNASHTHSGPIVGLDRIWVQQTTMTDDQRAAVVRYTRFLIVRLVDVIGESIRDLSPAQLAFGQGLAGFGVNRRRVRQRDLPAPVDHDVPVLSVREPSGRLRAVVFGYACHNTVLDLYEISGDYAGFAQDEVEKMHSGATALFIEGCGADINPLPRRSVELARTYGRILATAVDEVLKGKTMSRLEGPLRAAFETVDIPFRRPPTREQLEAELKAPDPQLARRAKRLLARIAQEGELPERYLFPVQVYRFGRDLTMIALAGEVVVDYSLRLKRQYGFQNTWVAGYSNDVFAYIPSLRVLREGGYEGGGGVNLPYELAAPFSAAIEEIIIEKVDELLTKTDSPPPGKTF